MRKNWQIHVGCLCILLWLAGGSHALQAGSKELPGKILDNSSTPIASGERILARLKVPGNTAGLQAVLNSNGLQIQHELRAVPGLKILRVKDSGNARSKTARLNGLKRRMDALLATGLFEYVEQDWTVAIQQTTPTDSSFVSGELWGLQNTGLNGGVPGIDVNAVSAWEITTGSPDVIVAVIDTGIRYTHQDLAANMWENPGEIPANGLDDDGNGIIDDIYGINAINSSGNPMDDNDHGTHVAGTIAATAFDSGRHVGVAYNVKLMGLKFLDSEGGGVVSDALTCIDYAIENGVNIINASWGTYAYSQALKDAIDAANTAGILFVAAAGNSNTDTDSTPFYPASYDLLNIISVAAVDRSGLRATFSNYGSTSVDLGAPGVEILSTTSDTDSSYAIFNGTSMAAPHVSGVAALVASHFPAAGVYELMASLLQTTVPLESLNGRTITGGMVDATAALQVEEDGDMEFQARTPRGSLVADQANTVSVLVTDLFPVTGATVTGNFDGESTESFLDDGVLPDEVAGDAIYTASLYTPADITTINLSVYAEASGKNPSSDTFEFKVITPPPNDEFANRIPLSNSDIEAFGTNVDSTVQPGEPRHPIYAGTHSVWWEWTPDISGNASVSTVGSSFDTTLAIYQGTVLESLNLVGENDDRVGYASGVNFTAIAGETYLIQVNGYGYYTGDIQLNYGAFTVGVPNDDFNDRILLESGTTQTTGTNIGSTDEPPYEQYLNPNPAWDTVWWEWIAPSSEPATISTFGSSFDTVLCVYEGTELVNLTFVAGNDDKDYFAGEWWSEVTFNPIPGRSYKIQVYGVLTDPVGSIVLNYPDPAPPTVANDFFAQRIVLAPGTTQTAGTNDGATFETGEPVNPGSAGNASAWWEWIAPLSGTVTIDTIGSSYDTTLAVYTGEEVNDLLLIGSNDDSSGVQSVVTFLATQGESYKIQVNGSGDAKGDIKLNYPNPAYPNPVNDQFSDRIVLTTGTTVANGTNNGATFESGEPTHPPGSGLRSVWWEWVAPSSSSATIDTAGSDFDTTLAIYTGSAVDQLTLVAENNDSIGEQSSITFIPDENTRYMIQVNGFNSATGSVILNFPSPGIPRPINDNFANRLLLEPGTIRTFGGNDFATNEELESINPPTGSGQSVWWEWIAPFSGTVTIDTFDSSFDTTLAIYSGTDLGSLSLIGENDDFIGYYSSVTFDSVAGESYMIRVDGNTEVLGTGLIVLNYPMPGPISVVPGKIRLSGIPGDFIVTSVDIFSNHGSSTGYTVTSPDNWITSLPESGSIPAGGATGITITAGALPVFSDSLTTTLTIELDHPSLSQIQVPVEIIHQSYVVDIPDPDLRNAVEQHLGRLPGDPISTLEMATITSFDASNRGIGNISGLEYATSVFFLYLNDNDISDILQLAQLPYLLDLELQNNNIHDISPLSEQFNLIWLDVTYNFLDINPGSDDRAIIDTLDSFASVLFDPQKSGMLDLTEWTASWGVTNPQNDPDDINNHLGIPNILAFGMGLDPVNLSGSNLPVAYKIPGTNQYSFTYYRNINALGITVNTLNSYDLTSWFNVVPDQINILSDDGNGNQLVEAIFINDSMHLFFNLEVISY